MALPPVTPKIRNRFETKIDRRTASNPRTIIESIKEATSEAFSENYYKDTKIYQGQVLIHEPRRLSGQFQSRLPAENNDEEEFVAVRVRIPDVHDGIPEPCGPGTDESPNQNRGIFEMHPLFVGRTSEGQPAVGDWVNVTFNKGPSGGIQSDGMYLGKYQGGTYPDGAALTCGRLVDGFEGANGGQQMDLSNLPTGPIAITSRMQNIADQTGVPVRVVAAFSAVESRGDDSAMRFECHLWNRRASARGIQRITCTIAEGDVFSRVASESNMGAFLRNYQTNKQLAVECTSFGAYQVMGDTAMRVTGLGPEEFWEEFQRDPVALSDRMVIGWFGENPRAVTAARNRDWRELTRRYNGPGQVNYYAPRLENAYNRSA